MLYESETWCFRENEMAILRRIEGAMVRAMCGAKLMEKKRTEDLIEMLRLKETAVQIAKANGVRWYGHVFRRVGGHVRRKALEFEVRYRRKDAMNRARWRLGVREIAAGVNLAIPCLGG